MCYINSRSHLGRFEANFKKYRSIILRLREVYFIDADGIEALDEIIDIVEARGQKILLSGISQNTMDLLEQLFLGYKKIKAKGLIFEKSEQGLIYLGVRTRK